MGQHIFETIFIGLGRALAAARRYENLRYGRARRADLAPADVPRRIFEEFYARRSDTDFTPRDVSGHDPIDIDLRLRAWRAAGAKVLKDQRQSCRQLGRRFSQLCAKH